MVSCCSFWTSNLVRLLYNTQLQPESQDCGALHQVLLAPEAFGNSLSDMNTICILPTVLINPFCWNQHCSFQVVACPRNQCLSVPPYEKVSCKTRVFGSMYKCSGEVLLGSQVIQAWLHCFFHIEACFFFNILKGPLNNSRGRHSCK